MIEALLNRIRHKRKCQLDIDESYPDVPIIIEYGYGLSHLINDEEEWDLKARVDDIRETFSEEFYLDIPPIPLYENRKLYPNQYVFKIMGVQVDENELLIDHLLAIPDNNTEGKIAGINTYEPCFKLDAFWITKEQWESAETMGYIVVNELEIIATHFTVILNLYAPCLTVSLMDKEIRKPMLYKGIFWITDMENIEENTMIYRIPVDYMGNIDDSVDRTTLNSKNHDNYNHKKMWNSINTKETRNKSFDYYPRGRVEISGGRATIFATPCICTEEIIEYISKMFEITNENFIHTVKVVPDYSKHYQCFLDRENG